MTGVPYSATTLERWNVVNRVLPDEGFDAAARAFAAELADRPDAGSRRHQAGDPRFPRGWGGSRQRAGRPGGRGPVRHRGSPRGGPQLPHRGAWQGQVLGPLRPTALAAAANGRRAFQPARTAATRNVRRSVVFNEGMRRFLPAVVAIAALTPALAAAPASATVLELGASTTNPLVAPELPARGHLGQLPHHPHPGDGTGDPHRRRGLPDDDQEGRLPRGLHGRPQPSRQEPDQRHQRGPLPQRRLRRAAAGRDHRARRRRGTRSCATSRCSTGARRRSSSRTSARSRSSRSRRRSRSSRTRSSRSPPPPGRRCCRSTSGQAVRVPPEPQCQLWQRGVEQRPDPGEPGRAVRVQLRRDARRVLGHRGHDPGAAEDPDQVALGRREGPPPRASPPRAASRPRLLAVSRRLLRSDTRNCVTTAPPRARGASSRP